MLINRLKQLINKFKKEKKEENPIHQCLSIYSLLNTDKNIEDERFLFVPFLIKKTNIETYTELLDNYIERIKNDEVIKPEEIPNYEKSKSLELFFTDKEGRYVDYKESLSLFQSSVLTLCHELIIRENDIGVNEHNRRILTSILMDLIDLGRLIENKKIKYF